MTPINVIMPIFGRWRSGEGTRVELREGELRYAELRRTLLYSI